MQSIAQGAQATGGPVETALWASRASAWTAWRARVLMAGIVVALVVLAGAVRLQGLVGPEGRLDKDEARLALAAEGVLEHGLPVLPTGRLYTRGVLQSYLVAGAYATLGRNDFAAQVPGVVAGTLLVVAVYLLGRLLGGTWAGLGAAGFVALAHPLIDWSRSAWMPSTFLLLFTLGAYAGYRGWVEARARWQVVWAVLFCLAVLVYEFSVLLAAGVGLYLVVRLGCQDRSWYRGWPTLLALGLVGVGLTLFAAQALALRAGAVAGPLAEARGHFAPRPALEGLEFYLRWLAVDHWPLSLAVVVGLPLVARARPTGTVYLGLLLGLTLLVPALLLQNRLDVRYALATLPLLAVFGAAGAVRLAEAVRELISTGRGLAWVGSAMVGLVVLAVVGGGLAADGSLTRKRLLKQPPGPTWLQALRQAGFQPGDLVLTEGPERARYYLGRVDFSVYARGGLGDDDGYARVSYQASDALRSIYSNAVVLYRKGDFERLVEQRHPGQTLWIVGPRDRLTYHFELIDETLWRSLRRQASQQIKTTDDWLLLRLELPVSTRAARPAQ